MNLEVAVVSGAAVVVAAIIKLVPTNHGRTQYVSRETWEEFRISLETRLSDIRTELRELERLIRERI